jgi:hypothetical protein
VTSGKRGVTSLPTVIEAMTFLTASLRFCRSELLRSALSSASSPVCFVLGVWGGEGRWKCVRERGTEKTIDWYSLWSSSC